MRNKASIPIKLKEGLKREEDQRRGSSGGSPQPQEMSSSLRILHEELEKIKLEED